jgi:hypothetical protein
VRNLWMTGTVIYEVLPGVTDRQMTQVKDGNSSTDVADYTDETTKTHPRMMEIRKIRCSRRTLNDANLGENLA